MVLSWIRKHAGNVAKAALISAALYNAQKVTGLVRPALGRGRRRKKRVVKRRVVKRRVVRRR